MVEIYAQVGDAAILWRKFVSFRVWERKPFCQRLSNRLGVVVKAISPEEKVVGAFYPQRPQASET